VLFGADNGCLPHAQIRVTSCIETLADAELDPSVLGPAFFGVIGSDRSAKAIPLGREPVGGNAVSYQVVHDRIGTVLGELLVVSRTPHIARMALDLDFDP